MFFFVVSLLGPTCFFFVVSLLGPTCTTKAVALWPVSTDLPLGKGTPSLQGAFEPPDQVRGDGLLLAVLGGVLARSLGYVDGLVCGFLNARHLGPSHC